MKKNKKKNNYAGFSFIEGIMAAFIVTVGMIAVIQLMTANLTASFNSRSEIMASFLAQEGAEVVRNIRDNNWAQGLDSFDSTTFPGSSSSNCRVDMLSTDVKTCNASSNKRLQINSSHQYSYSPGSADSRFQRKIIITYDAGSGSSATTATVTSVVIWGASFPGTINSSTCNQVKQCVFATVVLRKWGE